MDEEDLHHPSDHVYGNMEVCAAIFIHSFFPCTKDISEQITFSTKIDLEEEVYTNI